MERENKIIVGILIFLFVLGHLANAIPMNWPVQNLSSFLYAAACMVWTLSVRNRILQRDLWRLMMGIGGCLLLLFFLQIVRYAYVLPFDPLERWLWYAYHIPLTLIPLLAFWSALCIGREDGAFFRWLWLLIPWAALAAGILTNDLHLFWSGPLDGGVIGPLYYLEIIWRYSLMLGCVRVTLIRSRLAVSRRSIWVPLAFLGVGIVLLLLCHFSGSTSLRWGDWLVLQFLDIYTFMILGTFEAGVAVGLLPTNTAYAALFSISSIRAQIVDREGEVRYRSTDVEPLDRGEMEVLNSGASLITGGTRLTGKAIRGGWVYWEDDVAAVYAINSALRDTARQLRRESALLRRENQIKEEKARYEAQNRVYDALAQELCPQLAAVESLLLTAPDEEEAFQARLARIAVLGAFLKRRANLFLLCSRQRNVELADLYLSIREYLEYLKLTGVACAATTQGGGELPGGLALAVYDWFRQVLESAGGLRAVMAHLDGQTALTVRLVLDTSEEIIWRTDGLTPWGGRVEADREDETLYLTLTAEKGESEP